MKPVKGEDIEATKINKNSLWLTMKGGSYIK